MCDQAKLSIIVTTFGAMEHVQQCLSSLLDQSLESIEVICLVDETDDEMARLVSQCQERDSRVRVVRCDASSVGAARNLGLEAARGEYVHVINAQDYALDYAYEAAYNKLRRYDIDGLLISSIAYDVELGSAVSVPKYDLSRMREGDFHRLLSFGKEARMDNLDYQPWMLLLRREYLAANALRFADDMGWEDRSFAVRAFLSGGRFMASRDRVLVHRIGPNGYPYVGGADAQLGHCIRGIELVQGILDAKAVDGDIYERVIRLELNNLFELFALSEDELLCNGRTLAAMRQLLAHLDCGFALDYKTRLRNLEERARLALEEAEEPAADEGADADADAGADADADVEPRYPVLEYQFEESEHPHVSVIVPIFNQEEYLNQALHSLTTQTMRDIEFVCINDGSTDESMTIYREYEALDKRFVLIDKENTGYGNSMNRGIDAARGEYIGILEPDDFVADTMYERLYGIAAREDLDLIKANFHRFWINEDGSTRSRLFVLSRDPEYCDRVVDLTEDLTPFRFVMNTWSGIYKKAFLDEYHIRHNETPGASYQDNGFWFQTFSRAKRAWFLNEAFYMNRRDNPNSSIFSSGKLYAVTNEYAFIREFLQQEPELWETHKGIYWANKLSNSFVTLYRVAPEHKLEYLRHMKDEFEDVLERGDIAEDITGPENMALIREIVADPDAFHDRLCVSVIIPAYNAEKYIRECLDSVLAREEIRIEVICVDDGSTDATPQILREYEANDPRVRVVTQKNAGAGAARNRGMQYATGEYFAFLDADDFFEPDMLRQAWVKAHVSACDVVAFLSDDYIDEQRMTRDAPGRIKEQLLPVKRPFAGTDIEDNVFGVFVGWPWDKLFRAEFVREQGLTFQEQRTTNDMRFVFLAVVLAKRITILGSRLAHHRRLGLGQSLSVSREKSWDCFYKALISLREQLVERGLYERFERDFVNYALHFSLWNLNTLRGETFFKLYDLLKEEWFDELGITGKDARYFYAKGEYKTYQEIMDRDATNYLFDRIGSLVDDAADLRMTIALLRGQTRNLRARIAAKNRRVDTLRARIDWKNLRIDRLRAKIDRKNERIDSLRAKIDQKNERLDNLRTIIADLKGSTSYRVGQGLTALPRKAYRSIKKK